MGQADDTLKTYTARKQVSPALIIDRWTKRDSEGGPIYYLAYRLEEGPAAQQKVKRAVYERVRVGQQGRVRFLPREPAVSRLEGD